MRTGGMGADRWILTTLTGGQPNLHSQESYSRWHSDQERTSRCVLLLIPLSSVSLLPLPRLTWPYFSCFAARFSPDDKFSRHRVTIKKRFGVLLTQTPAKKY
jgi:Nucleolar RNA-binding protein, Nop10p family